MSRAELAVIVGVAGNGATFVMLAPQVVRLLRTGRTAGVSPSWAAVGATINLGWLAYVLARQVWIAIPAIGAAVACFSLTLYLLHRNRADVRLGVAASAALTALLAAVHVQAGWTALGTALALSHGVQFAPSVITAWRSHTPVGVSPLTWALSATEGALWTLYGALIADGPIVLFGVTAVVASAAVLLRLAVARDRIRAATRAAP